MFAKRLVFVLMVAIIALLVAPVAPSSGQGESGIVVNLIPYEGNPILCSTGMQKWERSYWWNPSVIYNRDMFHMLYLGCTDEECEVGYAESEDGLAWTRYESNPVFVPVPSSDTSLAAPAHGVLHMKAFLDGNTWVMLFVQAIQHRVFTETILRATAPDPIGPWTVDPEPVLAAGKASEWDHVGLYVHSILRTGESYVLYYSPATLGGNVGMATSPDGIHWTKYDNPTTADSAHAVSDPVFEKSKDSQAWDRGYVAGSIVRQNENGWEMFYAGSDYSYTFSVGYATSEDGITWTRLGNAPVLSQEGGLAPDSLVVIDGTYYLYYAYTVDQVNCIGVATGTVTHE